MSSAGNASCRHAFTRTLSEVAGGKSDLFVVTSDARGSVTLGEFAEAWPEQFVETGIAEQNATGIASGMALCGNKVFLCGPACFYSARAVEQIKNDIAYADADVKIVGVSGGVSYGGLGSTHHSLHDIALFRAVPNITVLLPADYEATVMATRDLVNHRGPVYMRLGRGAVPDVYSKDGCRFELGKANLLREGTRCAIIATGEAVHHSLAAAERLEAVGISTSVVDVHTIKPFDTETILDVCGQAEAVVTVEEHSVFGGLGGAVAEVLSVHAPRPMRILGFPDEFMPSGSAAELFEYAGVTAAGVEATVRSLLDGSS